MVRVWEEAVLAKTYQDSGKFLPRKGEVARRSRDGGGGHGTDVSLTSPSVMPSACHLPLVGEEFCYAATLISRHPGAGPG